MIFAIRVLLELLSCSPVPAFASSSTRLIVLLSPTVPQSENQEVVLSSTFPDQS